MSSKKKLITAITSLAVVAVIAVVAVTVTLAALNATVTSGFNITYTATNVQATISAEYKDATHLSYTSVGDDVTFNGDETGTATGTFDTVNATFSSTQKVVTIKYHIHNDSENAETGKGPFTVAVTAPSLTKETNNAVVKFAHSTTDSEDGLSYQDTFETQTVQVNSDLYVYVQFTMEDVTKNVALTGDIKFTLDGTAAA